MKDSVVLVTGGATGIGRGCVLRMASHGASTVIWYAHSKDKAEQLKQEIAETYGTPCMTVQADVNDDAQVRAGVKQAVDAFGRIDVVVNNAGRTRFVAMDDLEGVTTEDWDAIMNTNVRGAFFVTRACAEQLKKNKGCVVNISSIAGFMGRGSSIPYAVSKGALINLTKCLARAMAPDVRVNSVAPGIVLTDWVAGQEEHIERQSAGTLLGRPAEVEDVVNAVDGFVQYGNFVTGQTLIVDGGFYL